MSLLFRNQYIAVSRANRAYDFLHYNTLTRFWEKITPPVIQGIYVNYANHPIAEHTSHVTLVVGRKRVRIGIQVTRDILRPVLDDTWICIVRLLDGKTFQNPFERLQKRDIPILTQIDEPAQIGTRVVNAPLAPILNEYDEPPPLVIPTYMPADYHTLYRDTYDTLVPMWYDISREEGSNQNPNVITNRLVTRTIEFSTNLIRHVNATRAIPTRIARMIATDAVEREEVCPITMETITMETCAVTSCFHVFERDSLAMWHTVHKTCPVCKQGCSVVVIDSA
jgi:hypothetical protein